MAVFERINVYFSQVSHLVGFFRISLHPETYKTPTAMKRQTHTPSLTPCSGLAQVLRRSNFEKIHVIYARISTI